MNNVSLDDSCAAFCLFFFFFISSPNTFFFITLPEPCSPHVHIKIIVSTFMRKYQNGLQLGEHSKGTLQLVCLSVLHFLLPHIAIHLLLHTFVRRLWQTYSLYHMVVYCWTELLYVLMLWLQTKMLTYTYVMSYERWDRLDRMAFSAVVGVVVALPLDNIFHPMQWCRFTDAWINCD